MTDKTYCNGCGKFHAEVEAMIAMTDSIFVCNECVDLLHNIAQKKEREDPVRARRREIKLEETQPNSRRPFGPARRRKPSPRLD